MTSLIRDIYTVPDTSFGVTTRPRMLVLGDGDFSFATSLVHPSVQLKGPAPPAAVSGWRLPKLHTQPTPERG